MDFLLSAEKVEEKLIKILEFVAENGSITNSQIQKLLKVSKVTATRLLWKADKWLAQEGKVGQGTKHFFKWKQDVIGS
jgi:ATP-dependent DNA helicase RecG